MFEQEENALNVNSGIELELKRVYNKHQKNDYSNYFQKHINEYVSTPEVKKIKKNVDKKTDTFSFKAQFKKLCKEVPQSFVRKKLDKYNLLKKEEKQLLQDMSDIKERFLIKQWLIMSALGVIPFGISIFSGHEPLIIKIVVLLLVMLLSACISLLWSLGFSQTLTSLFSSGYKSKNKTFDLLIQEQEKLKCSILKSFKTPDNQLLLIEEIQHYRQHLDQVLGSEFSDNFKELVQIEKGIIKVFSENKKFSEKLWSHLCAFHGLNQEIRQAHKKFNKKIKSRAKEEKLKLAMTERLSQVKNNIDKNIDFSQLL